MVKGKSCILITGDLHLTDRKKDEYRWDIFPWITKQVSRRPIKEVFILGDLTHQKDNHSANLVLRLIENLEKLSALVPIRILKGNHDYVEQSKAFFSFLDSFPNIKYYTKPTKSKVIGKPAYFYPNVPNIGTIQRDKLRAQKGRYEYVFLHQCFSGSQAANGHVLKGIRYSKPFFELGKQLIAGDIHKPQTIKNLIYVGSPYPVAFGDDFKPRVLLLSNDGLKSIPRTAPLKSVFEVASVEELQSLNLVEGDQIRIVYKTGRVDGESWSEFKKDVGRYCDKMGIDLRGLQVQSEEVSSEDSSVSVSGNDPEEVLAAYCEENKITDREKTIGLSLLEV